MSPWAKEFTTRVLSIMRYCYLPLPESTNEEEWVGDADSGGMRDYLVSLMYDQRKKCFKQGYAIGAHEAFKTINTSKELVFNIDDAMLGAERAWATFEKDNE